MRTTKKPVRKVQTKFLMNISVHPIQREYVRAYGVHCTLEIGFNWSPWDFQMSCGSGSLRLKNAVNRHFVIAGSYEKIFWVLNEKVLTMFFFLLLLLPILGQAANPARMSSSWVGVSLSIPLFVCLSFISLTKKKFEDFCHHIL